MMALLKFPHHQHNKEVMEKILLLKLPFSHSNIIKPIKEV